MLMLGLHEGLVGRGGCSY